MIRGSDRLPADCVPTYAGVPQVAGHATTAKEYKKAIEIYEQVTGVTAVTFSNGNGGCSDGSNVIQGLCSLPSSCVSP